MTSEEFDIEADGATLRGRRWKTSGSSKATALIVHGIGEHSARYEHVALAMNAVGIDVVSYDQRGHGKSDGEHGVIPANDTLVKDAVLVFDYVARRGVGTPYLLAHSMGGAIAAFAVTTGQIRPLALILSSPAIRPQLPISERVLRWLYKRVPDLALTSCIAPNDLTHDPVIREQIKNDLLMHTRASPRLVVSILEQGAAALARAPKLQLDTLLLIAGDDKVVERTAAEAFAAAMPPAHVTKHVYEGFFHEVFNEVDRKRVLDDLSAWLKQH